MARPARQALDAAISEADFQQQIIDLAKLTGWLHYHTHDSRRSPSGFPDLCLAHPDGLVVLAELKTARRPATAEQRQWLDTLEGAELRSYLWTPRDWPYIEQLLTGRLP